MVMGSGHGSAAAGFLFGGVALRLMMPSFPICIWGMTSLKQKVFNLVRKLSKTALLLAITIHNFPEGLAVSVTFGALAGWQYDIPRVFLGAIGLAIGIGFCRMSPKVQPSQFLFEADGKSRIKVFIGDLCQLSWAYRGCYGAALVMLMMAIIPYALAFTRPEPWFCGNGGIDSWITNQW